MQLRRKRKKPPNRAGGFTFAELIVVLVVVSMFVLLVQVHLLGRLRKHTFRGQLQRFVSTMRMAGTAASESERRYEVIVDLEEQGFLLREITSADLSEILEEEIIVEEYFGWNCRVVYVEFDDGTYTNNGRAKFRAGHAGWQYGGKVVFIDENEQPYSVVVNRLNRMIELRDGDVALLAPRAKNEILF
jgi:type II secretory pathway pseudopilin PulG